MSRKKQKPLAIQKLLPWLDIFEADFGKGQIQARHEKLIEEVYSDMEVTKCKSKTNNSKTETSSKSKKEKS